MDNIIMTVGTSLVENYIANNPKKENITKEDILGYYEKENIEDFRDRRYGAEIIALENLMEKKGVEALTGRGSVPDMSRPRRFEIAGCINRFVK